VSRARNFIEGGLSFGKPIGEGLQDDKPLSASPHLGEDAGDPQGPVRAEADYESEQLLDPVALFGGEILQGLPDHHCVGLRQAVPIVLQALERLVHSSRGLQLVL
jgi:hypothetical protein